MSKHNANKTQKISSQTGEKHAENEKESQPELFFDIISQLTKLSNNYTNVVNNSMANSLEITNARIELAEEIFGQLSSSISNGLTQNMILAKDLLKCKDVKDMSLFQQKFFEIHCPNIINSHLTIIQKMMKFESGRKFTKQS